MKDHSYRTAVRKRRVSYIRSLDRIPQLSNTERNALKEVVSEYPFWVNDYYLGLIDWNNPNDPIRRLVVPDVSELGSWGALDASNENAVTVARGVQHKYTSTVLLLSTQNCGGFCRYCFRKRLFMEDNDEVHSDVLEGIRYIKEHPEVDNVLVTGGDPMVLSTPAIEKMLKSLRRIRHLKIIRLGSKMPAFNPYRFINDPELIEVLKKYNHPDRRIYFMCHFDHPNELTGPCREAIRLIQSTGAICLNQNPIIRGISDSPEVMRRLWNELSYMGIQQYYVFQSRPTRGNKPYTVPITEAYFNIEEAKGTCSGLSKRIRYVMSHSSGKVEIVGVDDNRIYLKYHRAKRQADNHRFLICHRDDNAHWLDQLKPVDGYRNKYYRRDLVLPAKTDIN